jgi:hypothetical protein
MPGMSKVVTEQSFGGRRAVVGDSVVIAAPRHDGEEGVCLCAGVVHAVSETGDVPWIARAAQLHGALGRGFVVKMESPS